jgi:hypothetical protein
MEDARQLAQDLVEQAEQLPDTRREKVDLLEAAVRHAETAADRHLAYGIRKQLFKVAFEAGEIARALVAFSACLAQCDEAPEEFPETDLHWHYPLIPLRSALGTRQARGPRRSRDPIWFD